MAPILDKYLLPPPLWLQPQEHTTTPTSRWELPTVPLHFLRLPSEWLYGGGVLRSCFARPGIRARDKTCLRTVAPGVA